MSPYLAKWKHFGKISVKMVCIVLCIVFGQQESDITPFGYQTCVTFDCSDVNF